VAIVVLHLISLQQGLRPINIPSIRVDDDAVHLGGTDFNMNTQFLPHQKLKSFKIGAKFNLFLAMEYIELRKPGLRGVQGASNIICLFLVSMEK